MLRSPVYTIYKTFLLYIDCIFLFYWNSVARDIEFSTWSNTWGYCLSVSKCACWAQWRSASTGTWMTTCGWPTATWMLLRLALHKSPWYHCTLRSPDRRCHCFGILPVGGSSRAWGSCISYYLCRCFLPLSRLFCCCHPLFSRRSAYSCTTPWPCACWIFCAACFSAESTCWQSWEIRCRYSFSHFGRKADYTIWYFSSSVVSLLPVGGNGAGVYSRYRRVLFGIPVLPCWKCLRLKIFPKVAC